MKIMNETLVQLWKEGIKEVKDLAEFSKDIWKEVAENLKRLGGWMKNPDREADQSHAMVPQTLYLFGTITQMRLLEASNLTRYYKMVGRCVTALNIVYETVIKSFTNQWVGLKDQKCQTQPM
eukprot:1311895-Ditylum_brightwellii.AAC.1